MLRKIQELISQRPAEILGQQKHFAILLPLIDHEGQLQVLYEVRAPGISQAGETSFPGGAIEAGESPRQAAVRETCEELLIDPKQIQVFGEIDTLVSEWAIIHCFVAYLPDLDWQTMDYNREEVARLFAVPLSYFVNHEPEDHLIQFSQEAGDDFPYELIPGGDQYNFRQKKHLVKFYQWQDEVIWGFTANLTHHFSDLIRPLVS
ncbi:NUDIX hydrolase [Hutsoniella sourekii]|uniref:NUDIX hydrolase n=1 Tax=Hutsoniella sourekii TaxID=87650 RepID=UPI0004BC0AB8|nr:CoA pyrophosphatase [Hutsoniella sourekii]